MNSKTINLKALSNKELLTQTMKCAKNEKLATFNLLTHLHEIQTRRLFAEIGYSSLWEYTVKELGYSESAAAERCNAMRLCFSTSVALAQIKSGELSLTSASKVQRFIYAEKKRTGKEMPMEAKQSLLKSVAGKSTREVEKEFLKLSPISAPKESERYAGGGKKKALSFSIDEETIELLDRLRELRGAMGLSEAFKLTLKHYIKNNDPLLKKNKKTKKVVKKSKPSQGTENTLALKSEIKNANNLHSKPGLRVYKNTSIKTILWKKARAQCEYISQTGRRCSSKTKLQTDHIKPLGKNGDSSYANLRDLCAEHNRLAAIKEYGIKKMDNYLNPRH